LGAGASTFGTKQVTLDNNLTAGDYYVLYVADDYSNIEESNETNNVVAKQIYIQDSPW
jgi:subtilase family serine protease